MKKLHMPRRLVAASLLAPWLLGGCFAYTPLRQPDPSRAADLRLRLSIPDDFRLTNVTMNDVSEVDGELIAMEDTAVLVSALRLVARSGFEHAGEGATLVVPRANIASIDVKRLSPVRTLLFIGGLVALGAVTGAAMGNAEVSNPVTTHGGATK